MIWLILVLALIGTVLMVVKREWMPAILVASLPFERLPSFDITGATIKINEILLGVSFLIIIWDWMRKREKIKVKKYYLLLLVYLLVCLVSLRGAIDIGRGVHYLIFSAYACVVFLVASQLVLRDKKELMIKTLLVVSGLITLFGLYQFIGDVLGVSTIFTGLRLEYTKLVFGFPRIQSTFLEPLYMGNFMIIPLAFLMIAELKDWKIISALWRRILTILIGAVLVLSISRGAYLGAAFMVLAVLLMYARLDNWKRVLLLVGEGVVITGFAFLMIGFAGWYQKIESNRLNPGQVNNTQNSRMAISRFTNHAVDQNDYSTNDRKSTYDLAIEAWKSKPLFGVGIGNFGPYAAGKATVYGTNQIVNNEPLEILAETGLVGMLVILSFLGFVIYWGLKAKVATDKNDKNNYYLGALISALVGIIVQYQFFSTLYITYIWFLLGWIAGLAVRSQALGVGRTNGKK
ncbi:MAG: O-antigen ligase family protein [bacterium]|nr:O-antigen ligase family protein [bacterium]